MTCTRRFRALFHRGRRVGAAVACLLAGALGLSAQPALAATSAAMPFTHAQMRLSTSNVIVGATIKATVVVVPRVPGRLVELQRQGSRRWRNLAVGVTAANGRVQLRLRMRSIGSFRVRAYIPATVQAPEGVSRSDKVVVNPVPPPYAGAVLQPGNTGAQVLNLQQRLTQLGYWIGKPDGYFGDATEQAVWAVQKAAGLPRSGIVGPTTIAALQAGIVPKPRPVTGNAIEIDLHRDLVMFVQNGQLRYVLNTSTGGGYTYPQDGATYVANTPTGIFHMQRAVNGLVKDVLGTLWRPRYFYEGFALHGDSYVPPYPVSHGCTRVSNEAIDWIWANNLAPIGIEVWIY